MKLHRQLQIGLWAVLFLMQIVLIGVLTLALVRQPTIEQPRPFQPSKVFVDLLAEKGVLSVDQQRQLIGLCANHEKMIAANNTLNTQLTSEIRDLFTYLLVFLLIALALQIVVASLAFRMPTPKAS